MTYMLKHSLKKWQITSKGESNMNKQSRWRSKTAWVSIISLVLFVLKTYFKIEIPSQDELVNLLMIVLVSIGVFNDPTTTDKF